MTFGPNKIMLSHSDPQPGFGSLSNEILEKIIGSVGIENFELEKETDWFGVGYLLADENQWYASVKTLQSLSLTNKTFAILTHKQLQRAHQYHQRLVRHKRDKKIEEEVRKKLERKRRKEEKHRKDPFGIRSFRIIPFPPLPPLHQFRDFGFIGGGRGGGGGPPDPHELISRYLRRLE